ncbi:hypothetical protein M1403_01645 [Patescibacteria group bacterium]|nr:hypothetical protein [Patescibacteria group bacterium]
MEEIKTSRPAQNDETPIIRPLSGQTKGVPRIDSARMDKKVLLILLVPILLGLLSGYFLYRKNTDGTVRLAGKNVEVVQTPTEEGVKDASTFKDTATGTLQENDGKITNEGTHVLVRDGGPSQNVYLTSSVIDLSKYVGKKVQIWGETFQGQKAGWLMDVGRIKVL